jgi:hypothetical protein
MDDIHNVASYTDNELFAILDLINPTDRELEAKILHMIWKYENMDNESGNKLARFFRDIFDHFFDEPGVDANSTTETNQSIKATDATIEPPKTEDVNYSVNLDFSKDTLNPLMKQTTKRLVSVDSQYRDKKSISTDYTFNLSDPLKDVVNIKLYSIQIPYTWYTINNSFGSNLIYLKGNSPGITGEAFDIKIEIGTGNYTAPDLVTAVNNSIINLKNTPAYMDISFGNTGITYDYPSSKATFKFDITKTYSESNFRIQFPYWTSPNDSNRRLSIPAFLGFNESNYIPNLIRSRFTTLPLIGSALYNTELSISPYTITNLNNTFNIHIYTANDTSIEYITNPGLCTLLQTISVTLNLPINATYSRLELFNALNLALESNEFLSDSYIERVNVPLETNVIGSGYSHHRLHINLNRLTTENRAGAKIAVKFPVDFNIWIDANSAFVFDNDAYELSNIISETKTAQSTILITSNPYIQFKCMAKYFNGFDANGNVISGGNTILNDYNAIISNSVGAGYTLSGYISEINSKLVTLNAQTQVFRIENTSLSINSDSKINFRTDINKTFTETSYDVDLTGNTFLNDKLGFAKQLYTSYTQIDAKNGIISGLFADPGGSGITINPNTTILVIRPKVNAPNRYVPAYTVVSGNTSVTYRDLTALQPAMESLFQNYVDPDTGIPVLLGTSIQFDISGTQLISKLTVSVRRTLTQGDFNIRFIDPTTNIGGTQIVSVGMNSIAYSTNNGASWIGSGTTIFSVAGYGIAKNNSKWIAVGSGTSNTIASSNDGVTWTGNGTSIFTQSGRGVAYNGTKWVAVGEGTNHTIAYSSDNGNTWTGIGNSIFSSVGYGITWNGSRFVALGSGGNTVATSTDGVSWTGQGTTVFSVAGYNATWNGTKWLIVGEGATHTMASSSDNGVTWTGLGKTVFNTRGNGVAWNGNRFVATGSGGNTLAYSVNGTTWTGLGTSIFTQNGIGISRTANASFIASGTGGNTIVTSADGAIWTGSGTTLSSYAIAYDICDTNNSWVQNLRLGQTEYELKNSAYSTTSTYSDIIGAEKVASDTIVLNTVNNMNRVIIAPITVGLTTIEGANQIIIDLPIGEYTRDQLLNAINNALTVTRTPYGSQAIASGTHLSVINNNGEYVKLRLNVNKIYHSSDYKLVFYDPFSFVQCFTGASSVRNTTWDSTLGWILGFRTSTDYKLSDATVITGDNVVSVNIYNYFMIVLDDYNHNHMNDGIVTTTQQRTDLDIPSYANRSTYKCDPITGNLITSSLSLNGPNNLTQKQTYATQEIINNKKQATASKKYSPGPFTKNVFALIPLNIAQLSNNSIYVEHGVSLEIHQRSYFGPVNLQRMTVKLVNDRGETVDLNGANWSFSFICEQLYTRT